MCSAVRLLATQWRTLQGVPANYLPRLAGLLACNTAQVKLTAVPETLVHVRRDVPIEAGISLALLTPPSAAAPDSWPLHKMGCLERDWSSERREDLQAVKARSTTEPVLEHIPPDLVDGIVRAFLRRGRERTYYDPCQFWEASAESTRALAGPYLRAAAAPFGSGAASAMPAGSLPIALVYDAVAADLLGDRSSVFQVDVLGPSEAATVLERWPYSLGEESRAQVQRLIKQLPTACVRLRHVDCPNPRASSRDSTGTGTGTDGGQSSSVGSAKAEAGAEALLGRDAVEAARKCGGLCAWMTMRPDGSIGALYVLPEMRGQGLARVVVTAITAGLVNWQLGLRAKLMAAGVDVESLLSGSRSSSSSSSDSSNRSSNTLQVGGDAVTKDEKKNKEEQVSATSSSHGSSSMSLPSLLPPYPQFDLAALAEATAASSLGHKSFSTVGSGPKTESLELELPVASASTTEAMAEPDSEAGDPDQLIKAGAGLALVPYCHILHHNTASQRTFSAAGFTCAGDVAWLGFGRAAIPMRVYRMDGAAAVKDSKPLKLVDLLTTNHIESDHGHDKSAAAVAAVDAIVDVLKRPGAQLLLGYRVTHAEELFAPQEPLPKAATQDLFDATGIDQRGRLRRAEHSDADLDAGLDCYDGDRYLPAPAVPWPQGLSPSQATRSALGPRLDSDATSGTVQQRHHDESLLCAAIIAPCEQQPQAGRSIAAFRPDSATSSQPEAEETASARGDSATGFALEFLAVAPDVRQRGLGWRMLESAALTARQLQQQQARYGAVASSPPVVAAFRPQVRTDVPLTGAFVPGTLVQQALARADQRASDLIAAAAGNRAPAHTPSQWLASFLRRHGVDIRVA